MCTMRRYCARDRRTEPLIFTRKRIHVTLYEIVVFGDVFLVAPQDGADTQPHPGILQAGMPGCEFLSKFSSTRSTVALLAKTETLSTS